MFALVLLLGLTSAAISVDPSSKVLSQEDGSFNITITGDSNETVTLSVGDITNSENSYIIDFEVPSSVVLNSENGYTAEATVTYDIQSGFDFEFTKEYSTTIEVKGSSNETVEISFEETGFCYDNDDKANLVLEIEDVKVANGFGDEDDFWYLMDEIEFELTLEPRAYDIDSVEIEWAIYNTAGKKIDDGDLSVSDIDEDDEETITFSVTLDSDIEDFEDENAVIYVRAVGKIDDKDSSYDGDKSCEWTSREVEVVTDDDFVIPANILVNEENDIFQYITAPCGETVTVSFDVWNIGEDNQDDVSVEIYSKSLEVYKKFDFDEIEAFENEEIVYEFVVPQEMDEGKRSLTIEVFDEDGDLFENGEDDESIVYLYLNVEGNCKLVEPGISAVLEGEAVSGEEIAVVSTVTNNEDSQMTYTVVADGFEVWAELSSINPEIVLLEAGESRNVTFNFKAKDDIEGEKFFNIQTLTDGRIAGTQAVSMNVLKKGFDFKDYLTRENLQIAGIVLLNLVLIIAIIIVTRKILKRK
jgi:hypothetical protein